MNIEAADTYAGGAAGCVIASRLAASLPALSILLIEGGTNNTDISVSVPILFFVHAFDPASTTVTRYTTSTEPQLAGRQLSVISGSVLGGGSSVNTMIYSRGLKREWDDLNMDGWRAADMLPYLQKVRTSPVGFVSSTGAAVSNALMTR
jgi:choline dehydrogenase-like flavoprotein